MNADVVQAAVDQAYAARDRDALLAAQAALEAATKDIPPERFPEEAPEAIGAFEMLDRMLEAVP